MRGRWLAAAVLCLALVEPVRAVEKIVVLDDDAPSACYRLRPQADGKRVFVAAQGAFIVFDDTGKILDRFAPPQASSAVKIFPREDGWFVACLSYAHGQIALFRPDGTFAKTLVAKSQPPAGFRRDMTGWTSPGNAAVDFKNNRIFGVDTCMAPRDDRKIPDPDWSRIAVFDLEGKHLLDINAYNAYAPDAKEKDGRRTWYDDIEVDPARQRLYATARASGQVLAFSYDGQEVGNAPGRGPLAVFPDGRVATVTSGGEITIYDSDLKNPTKIPIPADLRHNELRDLDADSAGRLYATFGNASVFFARWSADLAQVEIIGPRFLKISVQYPDQHQRVLEAGKTFTLAVSVAGRPQPDSQGPWQVMARPADGSDLRWQILHSSYADDKLTVQAPATLTGLQIVAVRYGQGPLAWAERAKDPAVQAILAFLPPGAERSIAIIPTTGRLAYAAGEPISFLIVRREPAAGEARDADNVSELPAVRLELRQAENAVAFAKIEVGRNAAAQIPENITCRLLPGNYELAPLADGFASYPLRFVIVNAQPDSAMQRIAYHEFGESPMAGRQQRLADDAERMAYIRDYCRAMRIFGFTRETDRLGGSGTAWNRGAAPVPLKHPGFAPAEWYQPTSWGNAWEREFYLDEALRCGICYDTQVLAHCDGVKFRDWHLQQHVPLLAQGSQWLGRFPAFYGFNYNDEMFFGGWAQGWTKDDEGWLQKVHEEKYKDQPRVKVLEYALRVMYDTFNRAVRECEPRLQITTTPMWQFPAVEGSYPPIIYQGMDETYTHFLSEGYHYPWYPAHSVMFLRLPDMPVMGVFDNSYGYHGGDGYLQDMMQVLGRGVQGVGLQHFAAFDDPRGARAYILGNDLARRYGHIFANCAPYDEAAVLYSYTQDITEKRNSIGTPQFERIFEWQGAALMAGLPPRIVFEESVAAGYLLKDGVPRFPMLFLLGLTQALPEPVRAAIAAYEKAGGKVFSDYATSIGMGTKLDIDTHGLRSLYHEGYAADTIYPLFAPMLENLAAKLREAVGGLRRFPVDSDNLWVSRNLFDGGAIRYILLATDEGAPLPFAAGEAWSLNHFYRYAVLPQRAVISFPWRSGVVYDVFAGKAIQPETQGDKAQLIIDMRLFPGRLLALAPAALSAPLLKAGSVGNRLRYEVEIRDENNKAMTACVPLRLRLRSDKYCAWEIYRGTDASGKFAGEADLPCNAAQWTLDVAELLSGKTSAVTAQAETSLPEIIVKLPPAEIVDAGRLARVLAQAKAAGKMTLVRANDKILAREECAQAATALKTKGIELEITAGPAPAKPGFVLAAGIMHDWNLMSDVLQHAFNRGLLGMAVSSEVPGPGRGLVAGMFHIRALGEHGIGLLGGDEAGLAAALKAFISYLKAPPAPQPRQADVIPLTLASRPVAGENLLPLSQQVGLRLTSIKLAGQVKRLAVTARGYLKNIALVEDQGKTAKIVQAARIGEGPQTSSVYISPDGRLFGASSRTVKRCGEIFSLIDADHGNSTRFAAFGDIGRDLHHFGVDSRGERVLAGGRYGVVCWQRTRDGWREAWAREYWKKFAQLAWPISNSAERAPQFHAFVPHGADYGLILFGEFTNNGWITPENACSVSLQAVDLATGKPRWVFEAPLAKKLLFPTLYASPNGRRLLLQVQVGSWGHETYAFYVVEDGKSIASWSAGTGCAPTSVAVADATGRLVLCYASRLVELRNADGSLINNFLWPCQAVACAFAADGMHLYLADQFGNLVKLDSQGREMWRADAVCPTALAANEDGVYAACWDGRLRAFSAEGESRWMLDCTPAMLVEEPLAALADAAKRESDDILEVRREATTSDKAPTGENLLASGKAKLKVSGTGGWMSEGKVRIKAEDLTNGKTDDVETPWLHVDELFWAATAGRQVWVEIEFSAPVDVASLTVYENPRHPEAWPTEGLVQTWDAKDQQWVTAAFGVHLRGPVNTYGLKLKDAVKIRYAPWNSYFRNFYTCEIEVRGSVKADTHPAEKR